jgi:hypothetical protein
MNERHQGYEIDCDYEWINLLSKLRRYNPRRFYEFYTDETLYYYMDKIQYKHLTSD